MSIFRKDSKEKGRQDDAERRSAGAEPDEELTDISEAAEPEGEGAEGSADGEMEEIYSTRSKQVKYKRQTPIEAEADDKRRQANKEKLRKGKMEFSSDSDTAPEVELTSEDDPDATVSDEIIEDISEIRSLRGVYVLDIDDIDISLDPMDSVREYENSAGDGEQSAAPREESPYVHRGDKIVSRVPAYRHESRVDKLFVKAGRFTDVVESEYDEYLKSTDPIVSRHYHAMQSDIKPKQSLIYTLSQLAQKRREEAESRKADEAVRENFDEEIEPPKKKRSNFSRFMRAVGSLIVDSFIAPATEEEKRGGDYSSHEDEKFVLAKIRSNIKKLAINTAVYAAIFAALAGLNIAALSGAFAQSQSLLYCGICLALMLALCIVGRRDIYEGLRPLKRLKGAGDTAAALACAGCLIQNITAMFTATSFTDGSHHLYGFIAALAMLLNTIGRLLMTIRVKRNFNFISAHSPAYAAKIYTDGETARRMVSGTTASKGVVAYQHITRFLSDFLKISYAPDPSEEVSGKLMPVSVIASLFVTVVYAIIFKNVQGTVSALAVMLCIGVPFTAFLAGNIPLLSFSRRMLREDAMVAGYPSVRQFCDTTAIMMNACELYPKGSVKLDELFPFRDYNVEDGLRLAAAVLREVMSPIAPVFDEFEAEDGRPLPEVESVMYEDKSGLIGWINGERVLIGNMILMNRYHISVPEDRRLRAYESKGRQITYIAVSGQLVAALALRYRAPKADVLRMQRAENSGLSFVISSPDPNVTAQMICEDYGLFYRSVKIMPPGYANEIDEMTSRVEETSRAYLATRGRQTSLARAIGGCIGLKSNISLGIAIGAFGMILGVLLCATLVLYASVARLSIVELMIYILFWTAATLIAGLIRRP